MIQETPRWTTCLGPRNRSQQEGPYVLGVLPGEGVGPEVIECALGLLHVLEDTIGLQMDIRYGGSIGRDAEKEHGVPLSEKVIAFCSEIFSLGGAILNGPGGGRYVYDLRKRFDLYFKISPLVVCRELMGAARLKQGALEGTDILLVRENIGGVYQGQSRAGVNGEGARYAEHSFRDEEPTLRRFLSAAARLARMRDGRLTVVYKDSGVPGTSALWKLCANEVAEECGISYTMMDVDLMAYRLIQHSAEFDVIAAPNLCGDVLADLGAVLLASRGNSFSGNFGPNSESVYQTNHGAAYDLAGKDVANPVGQIFSLAMALRETFGLCQEADWIEESVRSVWAQGWRSLDIAEPGCKVIGAREMGQRIAEALGRKVQANRLVA